MGLYGLNGTVYTISVTKVLQGIFVFGHLHRELVKCKTQLALSTKSCVQQFLHETGAQLCLYLVCTFVLG